MAEPLGLVLRTRRLLMHPMRREESDEFYDAVVSQDSVMRWLAGRRAGTRSTAEAMCAQHAAHWARHGYGDFAVRDADTHEFLGRVGLRNRPAFGVDVGFAINPKAQGRGIASEAGRACLDLAFDALGLPAVFGFVLPGNEPSVAVLTRLGAQRAGTTISSGRHCLRFRFDRSCRPARTEPATYVAGDMRISYSAGPIRPELRAMLADGHPDLASLTAPGLTRAAEEHTLTANHEGKPVACVGWSLRDMTFDGPTRRVAALGGVLVHHEHQGVGTARTLISVAIEHARAGDAETALLICPPDMIGFYADLGWNVVPAPVTIRQPDGDQVCSLGVMTYHIADVPEPRKYVDMQGPPV